MKIVIANSKEWFSLDQDIHLEHSIITISDADHLTKETLDKISPDLISSHIGIGLFKENFCKLQMHCFSYCAPAFW